MKEKSKPEKFFKKMLAGLVCLAGLSGCYYDAGFVSVRKDVVDVGSAVVGDSVHTAFKFWNRSDDTVKMAFIPECDCTTVSADVMELEPGQRGVLKVSVGIDAPGEFHKYVFVQAMGDDGFLTVSVHGHAE